MLPHSIYIFSPNWCLCGASLHLSLRRQQGKQVGHYKLRRARARARDAEKEGENTRKFRGSAREKPSK